MRKKENYDILIKDGKFDEAEKMLKEAWDEVSENIELGLSLDEAMQKAGFVRNEVMQKTLDDIIINEKSRNPYFPYDKPFSDIEIIDETIDELLLAEEYDISGSLTDYCRDLTTFGVDEIFKKVGFDKKYLFKDIVNLCNTIKENTTKPMYTQNQIKKAIDIYNEYPGFGQVLQILTLQGLIKWFEGCNINETDKGYNDAKSLLKWIHDRFLSVCVFYFLTFNKNENSKPLDDYLSTTQVGKAHQKYLSNKQAQENLSTRSNNKTSQIPKELDTSEAKEVLQRGIDGGILYANYECLEDVTMYQQRLFAELASEELGIKNKWKTFETLWRIRGLAQVKMYEANDDSLKKIKALFPKEIERESDIRKKKKA